MTGESITARRRLGVALRELRKPADVTLEDVADVMECSPAKISRMENGQGLPFVRKVRAMKCL